MGLEQQQEKSPYPEFLFYIESDKNETFAWKTHHKFNDVRHLKWPKLSCFMAKYLCTQISWINMRNLIWSKFIPDNVIEQFPCVPPSTSNAQQNLGPCRTHHKFNEVKISSKTNDNIVYFNNIQHEIFDNWHHWVNVWMSLQNHVFS